MRRTFTRAYRTQASPSLPADLRPAVALHLRRSATSADRQDPRAKHSALFRLPQLVIHATHRTPSSAAEAAAAYAELVRAAPDDPFFAPIRTRPEFVALF